LQDEFKKKGIIILTSAGSRAAHMTEEICVGIPEDTFKTKDYFVEVAKAQPLDGCSLPVRKRRNELDCVG